MHSASKKKYTTKTLLESLIIDDIYFKASGGGITFGGGEPALQSEFIAKFREECPTDWTIYIETSLNVPREHIESLATVVDYWYIDIKDMSPSIYGNYTGCSNENVLSNLIVLIEKGLSSRITVRVPYIPGFNAENDINRSLEKLHMMGLEVKESFVYKTLEEENETDHMGIPADPPSKSEKIRKKVTWAILSTGLLCFTIFAPSGILTIVGRIFMSLLFFIFVIILLVV